MTAPWRDSFEVDGVAGGAIKLEQIDRKQFALESTVGYVGELTGLEGKIDESVIDEIRVVGPFTTDLASVPGPLRWFVGRYGVHTPAALIHDHLIGKTPPITGLKDWHADRFFRFMLKDLGVRWIRRWLIWAAVATRTRFEAQGLRRVGVVVWVLSALGGMTTFLVGVVTTSPSLLLIATVAPVPFAALWGRQYGAGLVASYSAPWIVPPTVVGAAGFGVYWVLETVLGGLVGIFSRDVAGDEPYGYETF
jgi:hypothetical protein